MGKAEMCVLCKKVTPVASMVPFEGLWICVDCKPRLIQMIKNGEFAALTAVARKGKSLVIGKRASLPDRCVKCNAEAGGKRIKRTLYWHSPVLYLLVLVAVLIYAVVALMVRKKAEVELGFCDACRSKRRVKIALAWILGLLSPCLLIAGAIMENGYMAAGGGVLLVAVLIYAATAIPVVTARRIDDDYVWINKVNRQYLDSLPEWGQPRSQG